MFSLKVNVTDNFLDKLKSTDIGSSKEISGALADAALLVEGTAKKKVQHGGRSGRLYKRGRSFHQASAPGEPPKSDTGRLASSITHELDFLKADVGTDVYYAQFLEGKNTAAQMKGERPFLRTSLEENEAKIKRLIQDAVKRAMGI